MLRKYEHDLEKSNFIGLKNGILEGEKHTHQEIQYVSDKAGISAVDLVKQNRSGDHKHGLNSRPIHLSPIDSTLNGTHQFLSDNKNGK